MRYCTPMKSVAVAAALVLLAAASASAQRRPRPEPAPPQAPFVPQTLSTGGITTLPPPRPSSPFDVRPGTYAPRHNDPQPRHLGGAYTGLPYYNSAIGIGEYVPAPSAVAPRPEPPAAAPAPQSPPAPAPVPETPRVAVVHAPDTFYVIAGCYAGNRPPDPARLPKGCELGRLRILPIR